jgi:UDP-N-acetyl-alpha-D-muramoyl-L-alanyl-L-glutamate epimerase
VFEPSAIQTFRFVSCTFDDDSGVARFEYAFDDVCTFVETLTFPLPADGIVNRAAFDRALFLTFLLAGVSYYKAAIPETAVIESGSVTAGELDALTQIYRNGLGEFAYVNRRRVSDRPAFKADVIDERPVEEISASRGALVAVGGGKDSCVSIEIVRSAGRDLTLTSLNRMRPIMDVIAAAELPSLHVQRVISPELLRINNEGALNGHVPITSIVSMTLVALAAMYGFDAVVMSNERSASVGNTEWDGVVVNHQWSKSLEAERLLQRLVHESVAPNLQYFSLLRPMSELEITRRFAQLTRYHDVFTSCNRAFRIDESRRVEHWCRDCPKCRFVFLALAPFMNPTRLAGIFGGDMLRDMSQAEGFDALIGWNALKPFECVGEVEESVAAFKLLTENRAWRDHEVVQRFERTILPEVILPSDLLTKPFVLSDDHCIPDDFADSINATS